VHALNELGGAAFEELHRELGVTSPALEADLRHVERSLRAAGKLTNDGVGRL